MTVIDIFNKHGVFWAFGSKQFEKATKGMGTVVSIGDGGYILKDNVEALIKDLKEKKQ